MGEVRIEIGSTLGKEKIETRSRALARSMLSELRSTTRSSNKYTHSAANYDPECIGSNLFLQIPRVNRDLRRIDSADYDPKIISIGPYHHGNPNLQSMENHKKTYLREILTWKSETLDQNMIGEMLDSLLNSVRESEQKLLSSYSQLPPHIQSDDFVDMMVLDGCFIIVLLIKVYLRQCDLSVNLLPFLRRDLLLLENQLPFFILEKLYQLIPKPDSLLPFPTLKEITFAYLTSSLNTDPKALNNLEAYHILHLYDLILLPRPEDPSSISESHQNVPCTILTATKLKEAGIKLSKKEAHNFLEVSYVKGEVRIPCLEIRHVTFPIFRNLIAFEHGCPNAGTHFSAYARFMKLMVNNTNDVEVLQKLRIIKNNLDSKEEVVIFLNRKFKEMIINDQNNYLAPVFRSIDVYCMTSWHRHRAKFRRYYCSSILAGISVFTVILVVVTLLKTL